MMGSQWDSSDDGVPMGGGVQVMVGSWWALSGVPVGGGILVGGGVPAGSRVSGAGGHEQRHGGGFAHAALGCGGADPQECGTPHFCPMSCG